MDSPRPWVEARREDRMRPSWWGSPANTTCERAKSLRVEMRSHSAGVLYLVTKLPIANLIPRFCKEVGNEATRCPICRCVPACSEIGTRHSGSVACPASSTNTSKVANTQSQTVQCTCEDHMTPNIMLQVTWSQCHMIPMSHVCHMTSM